MKGSKFIFGAFLTIALSVGVGVGLGTQKQAKKAEAEGVWRVFYVYAPNEVVDYYDPDNEDKSYDWLEHSYDGIAANLYNATSGDACTETGGTIMKRVSPDVVALGVTDSVEADALELYNCYNDNKTIRTRSTWEGATPIVFDISQYNTFTISKYNCPAGTDSGSFNLNYGWSVKIQSGSDYDTEMQYEWGTNEFKALQVSLTAGTTFTIEDTLTGTAQNKISIGKTGDGSAITDGTITLSNKVFTVVKSGVYDFFADTNGSQVWIENNAQESAEAWAEDFVKNVGCKEAHNSAPANWSTYATSWSHLTNGTKYIFVTAEASNLPGATYVQQAAFIHDMCVAKKNAGDENYSSCNLFMAYNDGEEHSRGAIAISGLQQIANANSSILIATAIIGVSALALGVFLVLKRKKQD